MNLEESKITQMKEQSVLLKGGKLIFEFDTKGSDLQGGNVNQPPVPLVACYIKQKDAFVINKVTTRSQSQNAGFKNSLLNSENPVITSPTQESVSLENPSVH